MTKTDMLRAFRQIAEIRELAWQHNDAAREYEAGGHPVKAKKEQRLADQRYNSYIARFQTILDLGLEKEWQEFCHKRYNKEEE